MRTKHITIICLARRKEKEKEVINQDSAIRRTAVELESISRSALTLFIKDYPHTLNTAFRHLPPNSARFSYATEGALLISSDAVSTLRKVRVLI